MQTCCTPQHFLCPRRALANAAAIMRRQRRPTPACAHPCGAGASSFTLRERATTRGEQMRVVLPSVCAFICVASIGFGAEHVVMARPFLEPIGGGRCVIRGDMRDTLSAMRFSPTWTTDDADGEDARPLPASEVENEPAYMESRGARERDEHFPMIGSVCCLHARCPHTNRSTTPLAPFRGAASTPAENRPPQTTHTGCARRRARVSLGFSGRASHAHAAEPTRSLLARCRRPHTNKRCCSPSRQLRGVHLAQVLHARVCDST